MFDSWSTSSSNRKPAWSLLAPCNYCTPPISSHSSTPTFAPSTPPSSWPWPRWWPVATRAGPMAWRMSSFRRCWATTFAPLWALQRQTKIYRGMSSRQIWVKMIPHITEYLWFYKGVKIIGAVDDKSFVSPPRGGSGKNVAPNVRFGARSTGEESQFSWP